MLFGEAPASGRLPFTVYRESWGDATPMNDMSFQAGQGRSYKCAHAATHMRRHTCCCLQLGRCCHACGVTVGFRLCNRYLLPSAKPLYEFAAGLSYTTFKLAPSPAPADTTGVLQLGPKPVQACIAVENIGGTASPVVLTLFSGTTRALLQPGRPELIPNRQLIGFTKVHTTVGQTRRVCMPVSDADVAMVDDAGARVAYVGAYNLTLFDGARKLLLAAEVAVRRTVATIPAPDNPQPPCCQGNRTTCCC